MKKLIHNATMHTVNRVREFLRKQKNPVSCSYVAKNLGVENGRTMQVLRFLVSIEQVLEIIVNKNRSFFKLKNKQIPTWEVKNLLNGDELEM